MQFLLIFLLCTQSVLASFASNILPDLWTRDTSMERYTVLPVHPANTVETAKTEALLKELCGKANVESNKQENDDATQATVESWNVASAGQDNFDTILRAVAGVRAVSAVDSSTMSATSTTGQPLERRDIARWYTATSSGVDVQGTEDFLKGKVEPGFKPSPMIYGGKTLGWSHMNLTSGAFEEVRKHPGISRIKEDDKMVFFRALPDLPPSNTSLHSKRGLSARVVTWVKQSNADTALNMDSQFVGANAPDVLRDHVHVQNPGIDTYIYFMETGVQLDALNEVPNQDYEFRPPGDDVRQMEVLQTDYWEARSPPHKKWDDECTDESHGTKVASKAVGTQFGVAKSATIIPVKMATALDSEYEIGFKKVIAHIASIPGRADRSVVLMTSGSSAQWSYATAKADEIELVKWEKPTQDLLNMGVPIVCASGNVGTDINRYIVDTLPQVLQHDEETPIINVGNAEFNGKRRDKSRYFAKGDDRLMIYAPGTDVKLLPKDGFNAVTDSGTSFSAPQVAGLIATYLTQDTTAQLWEGLKGMERVKRIIKYLHSDESSWVRNSQQDASGSPIRMIWNGAGRAEHHSSNANGYGVGPAPASPSAAPPSATQAPNPKTKALSILLYKGQTMNSMSVSTRYDWLFVPTTKGHSVQCEDVSNSAFHTELKDREPEQEEPIPYPAGEFHIEKLDGRECTYKNDGKDNAGMLWCKGGDGKEVGITCQADGLRMTKVKDMMLCDAKHAFAPGQNYQNPVVFCEW